MKVIAIFIICNLDPVTTSPFPPSFIAILSIC